MLAFPMPKELANVATQLIPYAGLAYVLTAD